MRDSGQPIDYFEALAVNAGSLLTPVGNPQNILLWGRSGSTLCNLAGKWRRCRSYCFGAFAALYIAGFVFRVGRYGTIPVRVRN